MKYLIAFATPAFSAAAGMMSQSVQGGGRDWAAIVVAAIAAGLGGLGGIGINTGMKAGKG